MMTKVAIVHDYLTQTGGAELVALALAETFPEAPVYTSVYQPELTYPEFRNHDVRTTFLQRAIPKGKFRFAAPFFGTAFAHLDLSEFDAVIVSSSGFAHHIHHPNAFIYCHTPPHFIYDLANYTSNSFLKTATNIAMPVLRIPDQRAARRHAHYVANSQQTARRIEEVYGKTVDVIYPPLNTSNLPAELTDQPREPRALIVARLMAYKRFDIAIRACEAARVPLTIVGSGPDEQRLRSIAGPMTTFAGRLSDAEVAQAFATHSFVMMPGVEDFGFAPLDANYSGRPVVARNEGGARETVRNGETGILVDSEDIDAWVAAIKEVTQTKWLPEQLRKSTIPFQQEAFAQKIKRRVHADSPD